MKANITTLVSTGVNPGSMALSASAGAHIASSGGKVFKDIMKLAKNQDNSLIILLLPIAVFAAIVLFVSISTLLILEYLGDAYNNAALPRQVEREDHTKN